MSWDDDFFFAGVDEEVIRKEKAKARDLRKSRWWQNKIAAKCCYFCGKSTESKDLTMDHLVPLTRGGLSAKNNLEPCCKDCNTRKKNMLPEEWRDFLTRLQDGQESDGDSSK
ncbi:MAG: HNH endonuclease [Proteobacteria bacterium]|nr:HNH endonuclease [Pseudomonadota bacterium]MBU1688898.1 HNH endonuclease [Pseudomonadota bacterium]